MVSKIYLKEKIIHMYWNESKGLKEVAQALNTHVADLHELMKKLMIPTRSIREAKKLWWKQQKEKEMAKQSNELANENVKNQDEVQPLQ